MIRFSVTEMAHYLVSDEVERMRLLRTRKYFAAQAVARARFYAESRASICAYHRGSLSCDALEDRIRGMRREARYVSPYLKSQLINNADVLERYLYYQGHRELQLAPALSADLIRGDIEIRVRPSLFAIEDERQRRLIFLELREKTSLAAMRATAELAYEAFRRVLTDLPPEAVQVVDVRHGILTEISEPASSIARQLADACATISALWPSISLPNEQQRVPVATERQMAIAWDFEA